MNDPSSAKAFDWGMVIGKPLLGARISPGEGISLRFAESPRSEIHLYVGADLYEGAGCYFTLMRCFLDKDGALSETEPEDLGDGWIWHQVGDPPLFERLAEIDDLLKAIKGELPSRHRPA